MDLVPFSSAFKGFCRQFFAGIAVWDRRKYLLADWFYLLKDFTVYIQTTKRFTFDAYLQCIFEYEVITDVV